MSGADRPSAVSEQDLSLPGGQFDRMHAHT